MVLSFLHLSRSSSCSRMSFRWQARPRSGNAEKDGRLRPSARHFVFFISVVIVVVVFVAFRVFHLSCNTSNSIRSIHFGPRLGNSVRLSANLTDGRK